MAEAFKPKSITPPTSARGRWFLQARMLGDLQLKTIYRDLCRTLPEFRGSVLDVGCGLSPYRHLLDAEGTTYTGLDIHDADAFGFAENDIVRFDGKRIPFPSEHFDHLICTEVIEHAEEPETLIAEMHRVLKAGGTAIVTIPWSARYHYIPHDFQRFTPAKLARVFDRFSEATITPRGTDVTAIASKLVVLAARGVTPPQPARLAVGLPLLLLASPLLAAALGLGHLSTRFPFGSADDPIGYTIRLRK
jgi:ubiquinone/menaquinone biosynthesis C-methylase UbiE